MVTIQNFTEFYTLLKTHPNITQTISSLSEFIFLVERFKNTCSCRNSEKQRLKLECESRYRTLVNTDVLNNINLFKTSLNDQHLKFIQNNQSIIKEFYPL
jgi:hypothetical protein